MIVFKLSLFIGFHQKGTMEIITNNDNNTNNAHIHMLRVIYHPLSPTIPTTHTHTHTHSDDVYHIYKSVILNS